MNLEVPLSASAPMRKPLFYNPVFKTLAVAVVVVLVAALCAVIPRAVAKAGFWGYTLLMGRRV